MATRRSILRSSVFIFLAIAAAHVPACEYGTTPDPVTAKSVVVAPHDSGPVFAIVTPIVLHA